MSLRILFADDSVTAQNMGKKILTDAGYEVVAVSNGAAAVKKIAEQKPDIIILDVYMPGYSGLEVCEKVRGSIETLKTPVLLTVGKMEPFKPEDGNRVKADGVIVKPFEASDLLAIVKKFEERIGRMPARAPQPVLVERFEEEILESPLDLPVEHSTVSTAPPQPTVEVPDHMATTSAFSDLLGTEPSVSGNHFEAGPPLAVQKASVPVSVHTTIPDYELPASWREREDVEIPAPAATEPVRVQSTIESALEPGPVQTASAMAARPLQIPVYQESEPANAYEFMPTSTPAGAEIEIPREPELLETAAEATRSTLAEDTEPGLLSTGHQFETSPDMMAAELAPVEEPFNAAGFQDIPADIASHLPPPPVEAAPVAPPEKPAVQPFSDADFEARVAAALSAYTRAQEAPSAVSQPPVSDFAPASPVQGAPAAAAGLSSEGTEPYAYQSSPGVGSPAEVAPQVEKPVDIVATIPPLPEGEAVTATEPPVFEYHPPVGAKPEATASEAVEIAPLPTKLEPQPGTVAVKPVEAALPEKAAAAAAGADHHTISQAVHRVMERLKPELVEEIVRELKSKKD